MIRKLLSVTAALLFVAGFGVATSGTAVAGGGGGGAAVRQSVIPHHGVYNGVDQHNRHISFTFGGTHSNEMTHFTVGHQVIGGAHVSNGMWHETCHNGMCTKGQWTSDGHVTGAWRHGGSHTWTTFTASFNPPAHPYAGTYAGRDHRQLSIRFSFSNNRLVDFTLDHNVHGSAAVTNRHFETCFRTICIKGHWQTQYDVVGSWRYVNSHEWNAWDAFA
jgi:hypothetical protein